MTLTAYYHLLESEYRSKYGCPPPRDPAWRWEPWVGQFLRVLDPPATPPQPVCAICPTPLPDTTRGLCRVCGYDNAPQPEDPETEEGATPWRTSTTG